MNLTRVYASFDEKATQLELSLDVSHHLITVLRKNIGDKVTVFSNNYEADSEIIYINKKTVTVDIKSVAWVNRESNLSLHLVQSLPKSDKMNLIVQKATELGVASITPVISDYSAIKIDKSQWDKKVHQWQKVIISACEQSGRNCVPSIKPISYLKNYLSQPMENLGFILSPHAKHRLNKYPEIKSDVTLLIGPEGGFSGVELDQALQAGFQELKLGPRILRTETAGMAAISALQAIYGDL